MAIFVFVHGTSCGGWVWKKLSQLLRLAGHEVYAPTLTGLANMKHLLDARINLTTHITDICNLLFYEDLEDIILVGNSYGGMVITGVAAKMPERLKRIIYLDAYLPDDGQCEGDLLPTEMFTARQAEASDQGGLVQPPSPAIFGMTDPDLASWVGSRMTPHPFNTYIEAVHTKVGRSLAVPGIFIHCIGNPKSTPDLFLSSSMNAIERQ